MRSPDNSNPILSAEALGQWLHCGEILAPIYRSLLDSDPDLSRKSQNQRRKALFKEHRRRFEENLITNLSSHHLTVSEREVLCLGLSFIPSPHSQNEEPDLESSFQRLTRSMFIKYHFKNELPMLHPFPSRILWDPPTPENQTLLMFLERAQPINAPIETQHVENNLSRAHRRALRDLARNRSITIKPADKGGGLVVLDTRDYINKAVEHLEQGTFYRRTNKDHTEECRREIQSALDFYLSKGYIDSRIHSFVSPANPSRTSLFYHLPKIHKPGIPPRPIISGCDSPTDRLSSFVTHFLTPIASKLPSYICDNKDFLLKISQVGPLPEGAILVTADVSALYTNIPHKEGIEATLEALDQHKEALPQYTPPLSLFKVFLHLILENNHFQFLDSHYHQKFGTAIGTKMAPPYATIFMGKYEHTLLALFPDSILLWPRFIDDIFFIWLDGEEALLTFIEKANSLYPSIKLEFEYSRTRVHHLDTVIYVNENRELESTIYRKPTDKHMLLSYKSYHPMHTKYSVIYTQALRYVTIISDPSILLQELQTLKAILLARMYPSQIIDKYFSKALTHKRSDLLSPKDPNQTRKNPVHYSLLPIIPPLIEWLNIYAVNGTKLQKIHSFPVSGLIHHF